MLNRQRVILEMLAVAGGRVSHLALTKWCFLLRNETPSHGGASFYDFLPYHYGPFSFALYREADVLAREGLLVEAGDNNWDATEAGRTLSRGLPTMVRRDAHSIIARFRHQPVDELRNYVYDRYPWYTINSCLPGQRRMRRPCAVPAVYTMGYEGLLVDRFFDRLLAHGIQRVLDVRRNPVSRRYGFHCRELGRICGKLALEYVPLPELGIWSAERQHLVSPMDFASLFLKYEREMLPRQQDSQDRAAHLLLEKSSVLVCQEADPACCHRSRLAEALAKRTGLPVRHLEWPR
ncbi:MAG: DUF488 domain-containing protein [Planctomycetota bacterium]